MDYIILAVIAFIPVGSSLLDSAHDRFVKKKAWKDWWKAQSHLSSRRTVKE